LLIIPAVDLLDGKCVRLKQGVESTAKIYDADPVAAALRWQEQGAKLLHLVNLDGAFGRARKNASVIEKIIQSVDMPCPVNRKPQKLLRQRYVPFGRLPFCGIQGDVNLPMVKGYNIGRACAAEPALVHLPYLRVGDQDHI